ncbi:nuclear transport factor 2 family protein [Conexibacter sp. SYSU D00693]|uniref:nuclear transport factor 2 family protein n=1 Tax=Conexibacter sp. SYSU D00693 TaxID=2812560 RepID=UPI00196AE3A1|nr:nuclear transport factor 2 family protein [Conexibacter sp. SYSU D00693]
MTQTATTPTTPADVMAAYFDAWRTNDLDRLEPLLAPDVTFRGPLGAADGPAACRKGLEGLAAATRRLDVLQLSADGPDVVTWFELQVGDAGPIPVANRSHVEDGRITRIRVTFDPRPLLGDGA